MHGRVVHSRSALYLSHVFGESKLLEDEKTRE